MTNFVATGYLNYLQRYEATKYKRALGSVLTYFYPGTAYAASSNSKENADAAAVTDRRTLSPLLVGPGLRCELCAVAMS